MSSAILGGLIVVFKSSGDPPVVPESHFKSRSDVLSTAVPFGLDFWRTDFTFMRSLGVFKQVPLSPGHGGKEFIFQQVIHGRVFPRAAIRLGAMAFRPSLATRPARTGPRKSPGYTRTIGDVRITLGSTPKAPGDLGPKPADNFGPDATAVFAGPITLTSRPNGRRQIQAFDIRIEFTRPFPYDPAAGNLLFQVAVPLGVAVEGDLPPIDASHQDETVACRLWTPRE